MYYYNTSMRNLVPLKTFSTALWNNKRKLKTLFSANAVSTRLFYGFALSYLSILNSRTVIKEKKFSR